MNHNQNNVWVKVAINKGMFSIESAVSITLSDGNVASLYVNNILLKEFMGNWFLKVMKVNRDPNGNNSQLILLPMETFETSSRWAEVPSQNIMV